MKNKEIRISKTAAIAAMVVLLLSLLVMPPLLAAPSDAAEVQTVEGNPVTDVKTDSQAKDVNAISEAQAVDCALEALDSLGFDTLHIKDLPTKILYMGETAPAGDPIWAVVFRDDDEGYCYAYGEEAKDPQIQEKLAAQGPVESCTDENGTPGIRAYYSQTDYILVEINAHTGEFIRCGEVVVPLGDELVLEDTDWAPTTEEEWEAERQRQAEAERQAEIQKAAE